MNDEAPYCDACGTDFSKVPALQLEKPARSLFLFAAVVLVIALVVYLRNC